MSTLKNSNITKKNAANGVFLL